MEVIMQKVIEEANCQRKGMKQFMRKLLFFFSLFFVCMQFYGQNAIDSTAIAFKAKLFTVSEYGLASKERILQDIDEQEIEFLKTTYKTFIFMKISFSQPYRISESTKSTLIRNCFYYLAFNKISSRFYRIGGFDNLDIDNFFEDIGGSGEIIFTFEGEEIDKLDIVCLYEYYKMNNKERSKKGFHCIKNCREITQTILKEY